jgi:hypothetical protein
MHLLRVRYRKVMGWMGKVKELAKASAIPTES